MNTSNILNNLESKFVLNVSNASNIKVNFMNKYH